MTNQLRRGVWQRVHHGVFKLTPCASTLDELEVAAILACGEGAALSHHSAARRLGLPIPKEPLIQLSIPAGREVTGLTGVRVWRARDLRAADLTTRGPFLLTRLGRTVVDLASILDDAWLRALLDGALRQRRGNLTWISRALDEHGAGRPGAKRLRALLDCYRTEGELTDSVLESLAMELGLGSGRKPHLHFRIDVGARTLEVDLAWPERKLCIELDGYAFHSSRDAFTRDRARDRELTLRGWTVLRFTWADLTGDRQRVIDQVLRARPLQ